MARSCNLGAHEGLTNNTIIDTGTTCLQKTSLPGVLLGTPQTQLNINIMGPVIVGKARRDPGYHFNKDPAEDMMAQDAPAESSAIRTDPMFSKTDNELIRSMQSLMTSTSIGSMEVVALEMMNKFIRGEGGIYRNTILNAEIANNPAFVLYHQAFLKMLKPEIKTSLRAYDPSKLAPTMANINLINIKTLGMELLNFSSFWDKVSGLGITVHQVWSVKAELKDIQVDASGRRWSCWLHYTFFDHFGLDWNDIILHGEDSIPQYHTGDGFKAWYILQHYRSAKPFIAEMSRKVFIGGHLK